MLSMPDSVEPMPKHATPIANFIIDRPTCLPCIATEAGMSLPNVRAYLERISKAVTVHQAAREPCRVCGVVGPVVSIG
jgi:hypothetical protein